MITRMDALRAFNMGSMLVDNYSYRYEIVDLDAPTDGDWSITVRCVRNGNVRKWTREYDSDLSWLSINN